ncbi:MAG: DNA repair protein RecO [Blastochloris viridis]|uniref:DNA repair protein RecO n=1 Tax=Blastochloris viridis TaxID=1079 RepID=A0A6N4R437_BLAVI|nr:MAG: DNA repair protein RecO [Blastochloris viridis]
MQRTGEALVLATRAFGERDAMVELYCPEHGRLRGLVKGGRGSRNGMQAMLQPFNTVRYEHFRRLDAQLGTFTLELVKSRAAVWLGSATGGFVVPYISEVLTALLPEEHPYGGLAARTVRLLEDPCGWQQVVAYELWLLEAVGYGLRLRTEEAVECAEGSALAFVSPASGRAVPRKVAQGYEERLLVLPYSLGGPECEEAEDYKRAWRLTGFFIEKALHGKEMASRARLGSWLAHGFQQEKQAA